MLVKKGYGSYLELSMLPCENILDMLEYESILNTIESFEIKQAQNG